MIRFLVGLSFLLSLNIQGEIQLIDKSLLKNELVLDSIKKKYPQFKEERKFYECRIEKQYFGLAAVLSDKLWLKGQKRSCRFKRKFSKKKCIPKSAQEVLGFNKTELNLVNNRSDVESYEVNKRSDCQKYIDKSQTECFKSRDYLSCIDSNLSKILYRYENKWEVEFVNSEILSDVSLDVEERIQTKNIKNIELRIKDKKYEIEQDSKGFLRFLSDELLIEDEISIHVSLSNTKEIYQLTLSDLDIDIDKFRFFYHQDGDRKVKLEVQDTPTFFFRASKDASIIGYSTFLNHQGGKSQKETNKLFFPFENETIVVPGKYDPVLMQNKRLLSIPMVNSSKGHGKGLGIYLLSDIKYWGKRAEPYFFDNEMSGYYQSVGIIETSENQTKYRVIIEYGSLRYRDYIEEHEDGKTVDFRSDGKVRTLCSNLSLKLPMISKDGLYISGFDPNRVKTVVARIDGENCRIIRDLEFVTGKASFSYDSRYIAYHKYESPKKEFYIDNRTSFLDLPPDYQVGNIYIMEIETGIEKQITFNFDVTSIFPDFLKDGSLIYVNHPFDKSLNKYFEIYKFE